MVVCESAAVHPLRVAALPHLTRPVVIPKFHLQTVVPHLTRPVGILEFHPLTVVPHLTRPLVIPEFHPLTMVPHLTCPVVVIPEFHPLTVVPHLTCPVVVIPEFCRVAVALPVIRPATAAVVDRVALQIAPQDFLMDMVDYPAQRHTVLTWFLERPNQPDSAVADPSVAYLGL